MTDHPGRDLLLSLRWLPTGFRDRLLKESGWPADHADTALVEYARFIHLAHVLPEGAVPSRTVDAVWHLHLLFTESYWTMLCGEILRRPLHHRPGTGEPGEGEAFAIRYARTIASYEAEFGAAPPETIWPRPSIVIRRPASRPSILATILSTIGARGASQGASL